MVVHHAAMGLFSNRVGSEQARHFDLIDDELVLRTAPMKVCDRLPVNELHRHRCEGKGLVGRYVPASSGTVRIGARASCNRARHIAGTFTLVHRERATWVARVPERFRARALSAHRRGIAVTFRAHDRLLSNRRSRRLYARSRPLLDDVQRRIVSDLHETGYAVRSFDELFSQEEWHGVERLGSEFVAQTEPTLDEVRDRKAKAGFLVRKYDHARARENVLRLSHPWLRLCMSPALLAVANDFLSLWSKLEYVDLWYSLPVGERDRQASQAWHRDYEDSHLLKVFLYLSDVDEQSGPFEFIANSQIGSPLADIEPWEPTGIGASQQGAALQELQKRVAHEVPADRVRTFTGPKGTMIFCNTTGLHRGGFAELRPRVLATAAYTSPASLAALTKRNFTLAADADTDSLPPAVRYALA